MPAEKNIGLFVNFVSGTKPGMISSAIQRILQQSQIPFEVYDANWPRELTGTTEAWIIGGDGTLNYFINKYNNAAIPLAIFPAGTGNDFAWKLYGQMKLEDQVDHVLRSVPHKTDACSCNEKLFIVGVGIGFEGAVMRSMSNKSLLSGHLAYLWAVIKTIFSFRELAFHIQMSKEKLKEKFLLVIINNTSRTGGGFLVAPNASLKDGLLDVVLCKKMGVLKRLRYLPVIKRGKHLDLPFIITRQLAEIDIECETNVFAHLDGELISASKFKFQVLPERFLFLY